MTRWADDINPEEPHPEYPRPNIKRDQWTNLNGRWDLQISHNWARGEHHYPGPGMPAPEKDRAALPGEFGGEAVVVDDHLWIQDFSEAPTHYETSQSRNVLHRTYNRMLAEADSMKEEGLAGAVYIQTTDV